METEVSLFRQKIMADSLHHTDCFDPYWSLPAIADHGGKNHERGACLHCLRHTFAVKSFDKNERNGIKACDSVPFLSTYLGHDSLYETEKYLKYSGDYFADTLTRFEAFAGDLFPEVTFDE